MAIKSVRELFNDNNKSNKSSTRSFKSVRDLYATEETLKPFYDAFQKRIDNWTQNVDSLYTTTNDYYTNRDESVYGLGDADKWKSDATSRYNAIVSEAADLNKILDDYGYYFDSETIYKIRKMFGETKDGMSGILKQADKDIDYWKQFKDEGEYHNYYFGNKYKNLTYAEAYEALRKAEGKESDWIFNNLDNFKSPAELQADIDFVKEAYDLNDHYLKQAFEHGFGDVAEGLGFIKGEGTRKWARGEVARLTELKAVAERKKEDQEFLTTYLPSELNPDIETPDFDEYAKKGRGENVQFSKNAIVRFRENEYTYFDGTPTEMQEAQKYAKQMKDDEYDNYLYLLGRYGDDIANKYLDYLEETINTREAYDIAEFWDVPVLDHVFNAYANLQRWGDDIESIFSDGYKPPSSIQLADQILGADKTGFDKVAWDVSGNIVYQVPNILGGYVATSLLGPAGYGLMSAKTAGTVGQLGLTGLSSFGSAKQEMLNLGYSVGQANMYGALTSASEVGLGALLGKFGNVTGVWTDDAIKGLTQGINHAGFKFAVEFGAGMASEGIEEALQEMLNPFFTNIVTGKNEGVDWKQVGYAGMLGALSAGVMNGFDSTTNRFGNLSTARDIKKSGKIDTLKEIGNTFSADTLAYKLASKVDNNTSTWKLATLIKEMNGTLSEQNKADIKYQLMREGVVEADAETISEWLGKAVDGDNFTALQRKALDNNPIIEKVFKNVIIDQNSTVNQRLNALMELEGKVGHAGVDLDAVNERSTLNTDTEFLSKKATEQAEKKWIKEHSYRVGSRGMLDGQIDATLDGLVNKAKDAVSRAKVSESGVTTNTATSKQIDIKRVTETDGKNATFALSDGTTIRNKDVEYADNDEGLLYEGAISLGYDADITNAIIHGIKGVDLPVLKYLNGVDEAIEYGRIGYPMDKISTNGFYADLPKSMQTYAYNLGKETAKKDTEKAQAKIDANKGKVEKAREGKVEKLYEKSGLTSRQEASIETLGKVVSDITHNKVYIFDTVVNENGDRVFANDTAGFKAGDKADNGFINKATGEIYIDLHAGMNGEGVILWTLAHELTHFVRQWSPAKFNVLADFLMAEYGKQGVDVQTLIDNKVANSRNKLTRDQAYEEVVADAMQTMFTDTDLASKLEKLKNKDKGLWNKIKAFFADLYKRIKGEYKDVDAQTDEAKKVREMSKKTIERISDLFAEGIVDAGDTFATSELQNLAEVGISFDADTQSVAPELFSERTWTASEYVQNKEEAIKTIAKQLGVSESKARQYVDDINSIARLIADDRVRLDYEPNMDDGATVLKPNSEYKYTVDMSTLCAKRLLFTGTFDAIQKALPNTVFDSDDIVRLRKMMQDRNLEVACGICYVKSTRREIGRITQEFIDRYKVAQKTGKPITRVNSSGKEVALSVKGKTFMADPNYTPNLGELNTTDIDIVKRDHREVYDAYLAFMNARGQAKPKLLETRAEYKGEILKHFKAKSAVNSRNAHGGLRLQSFSDFEVPHMIDMMQVIMDMARVGLKSQAYTKVPAFAEVFGGTGVKINLSLIAKGSGLDADGNLVFDDVEGINHKEAFRLRDKYSRNVGTILVGKSDAHIIAAMADPRIDFIIPFHKSSWKESLYDALGLTGYDDYTEAQNEKPIDKERKIENFDPSEYWDFSKSGDENAQIYLQKCREDGRIPKFAQFQSYPGYWKLLIDFKMYDNNGVGVPQEVVQPNFDMDSANRILSEYKGGHKSYPVAKDVVDDFVKEFSETKATDNMMFSERNFSFNELAARDDLVGFVIGDEVQVPLTADGNIDSKAIINSVHKRCKTVQTKATTPTYYLDVPDIGRKVEVIDKSIIHGFFAGTKPSKNPSPKDMLNAKISLSIPEILANSIEVNRSYRDGNIDIPYSHVMMGTVGIKDDKGNIEYYAVRSVIEERKNLNPILVEAEVLGKLHAVNAKKIGTSRFRGGKNTVALEHDDAYYGYSVAQFLKDVKGEFDDTFSLDVYNTLSAQRRKTPFSDNLLFSERKVIDIPNNKYVEMYHHFGSTKNYDVAGYMLGNGVMLDFSGKHWGDDYSTSRQVDHRDVQEVLDDRGNNGVNAMIDMIGNGNIRLMPEVGGINLAVKPNATQMSQLRGYINHFKGEVVIDIDKVGGDTIHSFSYTRGTSSSKILSDLKAYFDEGIVPEHKASDETDIHQFLFSERTEAPPKKTEKAYKLMRLVDGKLYPLFIGNNEEVSVGTWYNADSPNLSQLKNLAPGTHLVDMKTGEAITWDEYAEKYVPKKNGKPTRSKPNIDDVHWANDNGYRFMHIEEKAGGKSESRMLKQYGDTRAYYNWGVNGSSKSESGEGSASLYALRPGWHFGEVPTMHQIGYDGVDGDTVRLDNQVWVEVEMSADVDYNAEAASNWGGDIPTHIPTDGYYKFATNPTQKKTKGGNTEADLTKSDWYVAGAFKVNRILSDSEADSIVENYNKTNGKNVPLDYRRNYGRVFNAETMSLEDRDILFSERNPNATDNRTLLVNALESVAQNDVERSWLSRYKSQIEKLNDAQNKLAELRAEIYKIRFTKGQDRKKLPALENEAKNLADRISRADKKLLEIEVSKPLKGVLERERAKAYQLGKAKLDEYRKERAESKALHYYRPRIEKIVSDLSNRLEHPSAKTAIPEAFGASVAKVLSAFNFTTYDKDGNIRPSKANVTRTEARESLKTLAKQLGQNTIEAEYGQLDIPPEMLEWIESVATYFEAAENLASNEFDVNKMNEEQLKGAYKFLRSLQKAINNAGKYYTNASYDVKSDATSTMDYVGELPTETNELIQKASKMLKWDFASPVTVFDRFGEGGKHVYSMLVKGQSKMAYNVQEVLDFVEKAYTEKEAKEWREKLVTVEIGGEEFNVTVEMLMGLHCLLKQEDSRRHILEGGGIRFADVKHKGKVKRFKNIFFNEIDAMAVEKALDAFPRAREVAEAMQNFMEKVGSSWGNEVSMIRFGYHAFTTPNYYPIRTVAAGSEYEAQQKRANIYALLNKSFTKERNLHANNAVIVDGIFSVFNNHMAEMALYNAWALPVIDTIKWFNYKEIQDIDAKTPEKSIHETFRLAYGTYADEYVRRLLESINSQTDGGLSEGFAFRQLRMVNRVAVSWNVRVALQQPFSIARAYELINPKYVTPLVGKARDVAYEEMLANSGIAKWKSMGYYDVDVTRPLETKVMKNASVADKFTEVGMKAAEDGDAFTWTALWNACKKETAEKNPGLDNTALLEKTAERFNDLILRTQVVDSVLAKSQWMRSKSFWHRSTSAFMSEPLTSYNALLRQSDKFGRDKAIHGIKYAVKNNSKGIAKATTIFIFSQLLNALVTAPLDALRDDDDYETYLEKLLANFKENAFGNLMPWNMMPWVSDVADYFMYGRTDRADMAYAVNVIDLARSIYNLADKYSYHKLHNTFNKALAVASQTSGFAVSNIWRDAVAMWNAVAGELGYGELKFQTKADTHSEGYKRMYDAIVNGDEDRAGYLYGQLLSNALEEEKVYDRLIELVGKDVQEGKITEEEATEILKEIIGITGKVDSDGNPPTDNDIYWMIDRWKYKGDHGNTEGYSKYDDIFTAMESGDPTSAIEWHIENKTEAYLEEARHEAEKDGKTFNETKERKEAEKKAKSAVKSAITGYWKPLYKEAYKNNDTEEMKRIRYILRDTKLYGSVSDIIDTCKGWIKD